MSLDWPPGFERTPVDERRAYPHGFRVDMHTAFENIVTQLQRMDVDEWRVDSGTDHRSDEPHIPYAGAPNKPDDPGVVARWTVDGEQFAAACDAWNNIRDNAQATALYLDAKRALERYGVATAESEFATARLPSADDVVAGAAPPHQVLGVDADATDREVRRAYRELAKDVHPDRGGDPDAFQRVNDAREAMLDE
ncbi:J domain-containing protein [Halomarina oriensis]|uniref:DnaJ domain-containing protein n=1 Tax=Halomarina oriensis TaxID=671145 RepID=A0A6B0GE29_9EURY|nr:J domain-containing protein [Halomarina oriensis]MWG32954.1 DnaJ domain-containing protein [Halomarina oriensis]